MLNILGGRRWDARSEDLLAPGSLAQSPRLLRRNTTEEQQENARELPAGKTLPLLHTAQSSGALPSDPFLVIPNRPKECHGWRSGSSQPRRKGPYPRALHSEAAYE